MSEAACSFISLLAVIIAIVFFFMVAEQRDELKAEAVKRGYAEWIVISENNTEFKWKEK